jgi:hypothetical protein
MPKKLKKKPIETPVKAGQVFHPWMLIGIIPLMFGLILYMGWAYESGWYWFYGIDPVQLGLPFALLFEQGLLMLGMHLIVILVILGVFFLLRMLVLYFRNWFGKDKRIELSHLFSIRNFLQDYIHYMILAYLLLIYVFSLQIEKANENYGELQFAANSVLWQLVVIPLAVILLVRALGDLLWILPARFKQRLRLDANSVIDDGVHRLALGALAVFAAMAVFNGTKPVGDASVGWRDNGGYQSVRRVYLESEGPIMGLEAYKQGCDCHTYIYGPLGYVANNEEYIFLIPWKAEGEKYFSQFSPLYQIERSETNDIEIIPYEAGP